jgi:hypothetical protein
MSQKSSSFALLVGIVDRPGDTLAKIAEHPRWRWVLPTIITVAILIATSILTFPLVSVQTEQIVAQQLSGLSADQAEMAQARMQTFQSPAFMIGMSIVMGSLGMVFGWLIQSGILYIGTVLGGKDVVFGRFFAAAPWLGLPFALEQLLQTGWTMYRGKLIVNQGLSYLVSIGRQMEDARNLAYVLLGHVSLFRLWHLVLVYALLRTVGRCKGGTAFWLTILYAAVTIGGAAAFAMFGARLSPSF